VQNICLQNGGVYTAAEPLLGCSGPIEKFGSSGVFIQVSNWATRLADTMRSDFDRVIVAPIGRASSRTSHWASGGAANHRIKALSARLRDRGYIEPSVSIFILQQLGSNDHGVAAATVTANVQSIAQTFIDEGVTAPFFVAKNTWNITVDATVQTGLMNAVNGTTILTGADTDTLDGTKRYDDAHFTAAGAADAADLWYDAISSHF